MAEGARVVVVSVPGTAVEPLTVAELRTRARIDRTDEDGLLADLIAAARQQVELDTDRNYVTQSWDARVTGPAGWVALPWPPLQAVTTVTGYDAAGVPTALDPSTYQVDTVSQPGRVWLRDQWASWVIRYVAGYPADALPPLALQGIGLLAVHYATTGRDAVAAGLATVPLGYQEIVDRLHLVTVA